MTATQALIVVVGFWVLTGVVSAVVMRRHGHHLFAWGALGVAFGPLVIPLAVSSLRSDAMGVRSIAAGEPGAGPVDVLMGLDGSPESDAAMWAALELFAGRIGRIALAAVIDFDTFDSAVAWPEQDDALAELERRASEISNRGGPRPETVLLSGVPAEALQRFARERGFDVLVVGRRGRGASRAFLGSVATRLARESLVPVLLVGPQQSMAA
jgi:nucleotide-binding universal stress UspA family protein